MKAFVAHHLSLIHFTGLGVRFFFTLFLIKNNQIEALGFYGLMCAIETLMPYLLGLEIHTFSTRRYVKNQTKTKFSTIVSLHWGFISITLPIAAIISPLVLYLLNATDNLMILFLSSVICMAAMILQETIRASVILKKPEASVYLTFMRSSSWQPVAIFIIFFTKSDALLTIMLFWALTTTAAMLWSLKIVGIEKIPRSRLRFKYILNAINMSKDYYVVAVAGAVTQNIDRLLLQMTMGLQAVGIYTLIQSLASSINGAVQSSIINKKAMAILEIVPKTAMLTRPIVVNTSLSSFKYSVILSLFILMLLYPLALLTDKLYLLDYYTPLLLLLTAQTINMVGQPFHLALYAVHKDRELRNIMMFSLFVAPLFLFFGSNYFGVSGVAAGLMFLSILVTWLKINQYRKLLSTSPQ